MKKQKVQEPEFLSSASNMQTRNYNVYYMKMSEKIIYFIMAFAVGAAVGYLFYGGIGKDEFGEPTTVTYVLNILIPAIVGAAAGFLYLPMRVKTIIEKRRKKLREQFRSMLDSLSTSIGAGKNVLGAFTDAYDDMQTQYSEDAFIINELQIILTDIRNNNPVEDALADFGKRSGIDDIVSFADVFKICYQKGGNIKDVIKNTHIIINDKMEIIENIETLVTSNKLEQNIMIFMPIILVGMIKMMNPDFAANFVSPSGIISTTISVIIFVVAYFVGKAVLNIKI